MLALSDEITIWDPAEDNNLAMPIFEGEVAGAFMSLSPGLYPFSLVSYEDTGGGDMQDVTRRYLLIVTGDESFAVYTDVEYESILEIDTDI